jgi:uncharacterized protein YjdB
MMKKNKGVTLIALAVTTIVLLIISGVAISYLTGNTGLVNRANSSKEIAGITEEKEVLSTSVAAAVGKSSKSKVEEVYLKRYFNQNIGEEVKDYTLTKSNDGLYHVKFVKSGREYVILDDGTVKSNDEFEKEDYARLIPSAIKSLEKGERQEIRLSTNKTSRVSWSTTDETIVRIETTSENKVINVLGLKNGKTTVIAKVDGLEAKCEIEVKTNPKGITLSQSELTIDLSTNKKTIQLTANITPNDSGVDKTVDWKSGDTSIAKVDEYGYVTGISNGETRVTATTVNGLTATCMVTVETTPISISLNKSSATIDTTKDSALQLIATINPPTANKDIEITWKTSRESLAKVVPKEAKENRAEAEVIGGEESGVAIITATTKNGCSAQCSVIVGATITGINIVPQEQAIEIGEEYQLHAEKYPESSKESIGWKIIKEEPDDGAESVATINSDGVVTGVAHGTVTIQATGRDSLVTSTSIVKVQTAPKSVTLDTTEKVIDLSTDSKLFKLNATINPSTANVFLDLTWSTSDANVAKVDENGNVYAVANGKAVITVRTGNDKTATCTVTVQTSPTGIALKKKEVVVNRSSDKNKIAELEAIITPSTANVFRNLSWSAEDPKIVTVTKRSDSSDEVKADVTGLENGSTTVTVRTENGLEASCKVIVETKIIGITVSPASAVIEVGETVQFEATKKPSIGTTEGVTWRSENESVATVDQNGLVTGVGNGVVKITVKSSSGLIHQSVTVTVQTSPKGISMKDSLALDLSTKVSDTLQATITPSTANVNKEITWKSDNTGIATVDGNGKVTAVGNGTTKITATTANGKSASCTVTVTTAITSISVSPTSKTLKTGETVQLTATKNPSTATEGITWTTSNSSVATVSNGLVTAKGSGTATITVKSSTGGKSATCTITVSNPVQTKTWSISKYSKTVVTEWGEHLFTGYEDWDTYDLGGSYTINSLSGTIKIDYSSYGKEEKLCVYGAQIEAYNGSSWDVIYKRTREFGSWLTSGTNSINESIQGFKDIHDIKNDTMDATSKTTAHNNSLTRRNKKYSKLRARLYISDYVPESIQATGSVTLNVSQ